MTDFGNLDELKEWLIASGIDVSSWGCGGTKSVANLWDELVNGEIYIQDNPPLRVVQVVRVIVRKDGRVLVELEQEFGDGTRRFRNYLPAEKIKPGESCTDAALRCLEEELSIARQNVTFVTPTCQRKQKVADSPSYPGLLTRYTFHTIETKVSGLPDTDFWRDNVAYKQGDPVKRQHWVWRTSPDC